MNAFYAQQHTHSGEHCCGSATIHIPKDKMNSLTRLVKEEIIDSKTFFSKEDHKNMRAVLSAINESFSHIVSKAKKQNMELPDFDEEAEGGVNMRKKILAKCIGESLNRHVATVLKATILSKEQTISKAPMLLANPMSLRATNTEGLTIDEAKAR